MFLKYVWGFAKSRLTIILQCLFCVYLDMYFPNPFHFNLIFPQPQSSFQLSKKMSQQCFCRNLAMEWRIRGELIIIRIESFQHVLMLLLLGWTWVWCLKQNYDSIKRRIGRKNDQHIMELVRVRNKYNEEVKKLKNEPAFVCY